MTEGAEVRPGTVDWKILSALTEGRYDDSPWGRASPGMIADSIDVTSQHVIDRMNVLLEGEYVVKPSRGLYEITEKGISSVEES